MGLGSIGADAKFHSPDGGYGRMWVRHKKGWHYFTKDKKTGDWNHDASASHSELGADAAGREMPRNHPSVSKIIKQHYSLGENMKEFTWKDELAGLVQESLIMEPGFVKGPGDEKKWKKAKTAAKKGGARNNYALANYIFHQMKKGEGVNEALPRANQPSYRPGSTDRSNLDVRMPKSIVPPPKKNTPEVPKPASASTTAASPVVRESEGEPQITIKRHGASVHPIGGNPQLHVTIDGLPELKGKSLKTHTFKQGGINLWAFPERTKLGSTSQSAIDKALAKEWDRAWSEAKESLGPNVTEGQIRDFWKSVKNVGPTHTRTTPRPDAGEIKQAAAHAKSMMRGAGAGEISKATGGLVSFKSPSKKTEATTSTGSSGYEVAYRIPGKGGWKRKIHKSEQHARNWAAKIRSKEGDDVEVLFPPAQKTEAKKVKKPGPRYTPREHQVVLNRAGYNFSGLGAVVGDDTFSHPERKGEHIHVRKDGSWDAQDSNFKGGKAAGDHWSSLHMYVNRGKRS